MSAKVSSFKRLLAGTQTVTRLQVMHRVNDRPSAFKKLPIDVDTYEFKYKFVTICYKNKVKTVFPMICNSRDIKLMYVVVMNYNIIDVNLSNTKLRTIIGDKWYVETEANYIRIT